MLSVPTLWTVFVINFLALGLIWAYVMRSYPTFQAARFWTASSFAAAAGAALAMGRVFLPDSLWPLLFGGVVLVFAACLAAQGIRRFYDQPVGWLHSALITGLTFVSLSFFIVVHDSVPARISIYTIAQILPLAMSLKLLLAPPDRRINAGARLAGIVAILIVGIYMLRLLAGLAHFGGEFSFIQFNQFQSALILVLVFLSMALNFGFLLMAMD